MHTQITYHHHHHIRSKVTSTCQHSEANEASKLPLFPEAGASGRPATCNLVLITSNGQTKVAAIAPEKNFPKPNKHTNETQEKENWKEKDQQNWTCGGSGTGVAGGFSNAPVIKGRALILNHLYKILIKTLESISKSLKTGEISSSWWSSRMIINSSRRYCWHLTRPGKCRGGTCGMVKGRDFVPQGNVAYGLGGLRLNTKKGSYNVWENKSGRIWFRSLLLSHQQHTVQEES